VLRKHHDWDLGVDLLNLRRDHRAVQEAQLVFDHDCIHGTRHEKPQAVATIGCGYQVVPVLFQ
jgi:hypothetical protein